MNIINFVDIATNTILASKANLDNFLPRVGESVILNLINDPEQDRFYKVTDILWNYYSMTINVFVKEQIPK